MRNAFFLMMSLLMMGPPAFAIGGDHVENGGDAFSAEFTQIGHRILKSMKTVKNPLFATEDFQKALRETRVVSEDRLFLGDREVDAINTSRPPKIRLSRKRWSELTSSKSYSLKMKLVLHEYLGVMGFDDNSYTFSNALIDSLEIHQKGLSDLQGPVNSIRIRHAGSGKICADLDFSNEPQWSHEHFQFACEDAPFELALRSLDPPIPGKKKKSHRHFEMSVRDPVDRSTTTMSYLHLNACQLTPESTCLYSGWISMGPLQLQLLRKKAAN